MQEQFIDELNTEDINDYMPETLLESLSLEIMETTIIDQINGDRSSDRDFLGTVLDKFNAISKYADPDNIRGIRYEIVDWANRLITAIVNEYNLGYNNPGEETLESLDILESLYHFFILDRKRYTKDFFIKYIDINKEQIAEDMGINNKGNDVTTIANRKKNIDKANVPILSNIAEVVQHIIRNVDISTDLFLDLVDEGEVYTSNIRYYFDSGILIGDFFHRYIEEDIGDYTDDVSGELRTAIRMNLSI
jgi:hypothetical protein